ncbi:unnamed protein product [Penicillium camemberti]|uniref:Str. FM013 n=1 Tax=Penicillium camemberti (strain FM 013) TaxID=1429867 RepID=A0A0G4P2L9_PENC3|nr:unnamed protein product [Penicillium camemberti]
MVGVWETARPMKHRDTPERLPPSQPRYAIPLKQRSLQKWRQSELVWKPGPPPRSSTQCRTDHSKADLSFNNTSPNVSH